MAEDFQAGICGGNWWSSSRSMLVAVGGLSPCSVGFGDLGSYGWPPADDFTDIKQKSCSESNSVSDNSMIDSGLQAMNFALASSATSDWNQTDFLCSNGIDACNDQIQKNWSPSNFSTGISNDETTFFLDQNRLNSINCSSASCFPLDSTLSGYPSKLLQSLYDPEPHRPQQPLYNARPINCNNYGTNSNDLSLSSTNFVSNLKPSLAKQPLSAALHFTNNTPFWNASAAASSDISQNQVLASILEEKSPKGHNTLALKPHNTPLEDAQDPGSKKGDKTSTTEPVFKRPRIETPSPLPTFKVRKEKLGDRVTALQQLVSPFGKTDTASVLHEAIEYIKFLHDQVSVLSTPYMKNNNGALIQHQQVSDKLVPECPKQDLRSRGLCLVPISSTFPVTNATTPDFWTPTFGGTFR